MGELILALVPVSFGIILSPLAIMALIAILVSERARVNGTAYLLGWTVGLCVVLAVSTWVFVLLEIQAVREPPMWVAVVRLALGLFLVGGAVWVYRKGHAHVAAMARASTPGEVVAAAPQLPGWLRAVATFRPVRSFFLGLGLFVLNPVDASCAIIAGLDAVLADVSPAQSAIAVMVFALVGILPIAVPVIAVLFLGTRLQPTLGRLRTWVATHTNVLNAALLLVIGALQLEKGIAALL